VVYRFLNGLDTINGDGEQVRDFVWVEDVALALFEAATSKKYNGIYNISTGKKRTIAGLFKQLFPDLIPVHGPLLKEIQVSTLSPAKAMAKGFKPRDILWQTK
jgi:nucleoside-diphosphate-sugar epimerase